MPILDFLAKYALVAGREWFRFMEWLLIIATLSFAASVSESLFVKSLWLASIGILWVYIFFGYGEAAIKLRGPHPQETGDTRKDLIALAKTGVFGITTSIILWVVAEKLSSIALEFATKLAPQLR